MIKLKPHETTAIARPISRMVARRPWLHRIIRNVTDPLLLIGTTGAVARVRVQHIRLIKLGALPMPHDPVAEYEQARAAAERATRDVVQPPTVDTAAPAAESAGGGGYGYTPPPAAAANAEPLNHSAMVKGPHVPGEIPELRSALAQMAGADAA